MKAFFAVAGRVPVSDWLQPGLGTVIGDLNSRWGQVLSLNERGTAKVGDEHGPLSSLFGYVPRLRGLSRGRANETMRFAHYAPVPAVIAVIAAKAR